MNSIPKKKLCWNCEGRVSFSDENCLFCGVYLNPTDNDRDSDDLPEIKAPYALIQEESNEPVLEAVEELNQPFDAKNSLVAISFLLVGSIALLFSLMLFTFSKDGMLTLQWNASFWLYYLLVAIPALFFGWRTINKL